MADKKLRSYVERELKKKVNPGLLKYNLVNAGWPESEVDDAISNYSSKNKAKAIIFLSSFALVAVLAISLLLLVDRPLQDPPPGNGVNIPPQEPPLNNNNVAGNDVEENGDCWDLDSMVEKDICYIEIVSEGFDCRDIPDDLERTYCFRALETYLLSSA